MKNIKGSWLLALSLALVLGLTACSSGSSPTDAVKKYMRADAQGDMDEANEHLCDADQGSRVLDLRGEFDEEEVSIDVSKLKYDKISENENVAVVEISGKIKVETAGTSVEIDIDKEIAETGRDLLTVTVVREDGDWKVCPSMDEQD